MPAAPVVTPIERSAGILLHVTSLPGPYGTGTFGAGARDFIRHLSRAGIRYWQMLPLGHPEAAFSPYQCFSAFAGNPSLIDPEDLAATGLVSAAEVAGTCLASDAIHANFAGAASSRAELLRLAASRLDPAGRQAVTRFARDHSGWLTDYALFMTIRAHFDGLPWWEWPDQALRRHDPEALRAFAAAHAAECFLHHFTQYEFHRQWAALRDLAGRAGVLLFGDMPIYVARDSADVWAHTDLFELDRDLNPLRVAGVPPDYFAADGQLWGNPLYDWQAMAADGYAWWLDRVAYALTQFDLLRLDHFRGFEAYWAVPAAAATAREGQWVDGPGQALFDRVDARCGPGRIVAEDLGLLTERTYAFLRQTGYPGMRVMQFAFDGNRYNDHLPHRYPRHCVAYVGTHDNDTLAGWLEHSDAETVAHAARYCRAPDTHAPDAHASGAQAPDAHRPDPRPAVFAWIETLWASVADLTVVTAQDLLALDGGRRMNVPGTASGNWGFRLTSREMADIPWEYLRELGDLYGRS